MLCCTVFATATNFGFQGNSSRSGNEPLAETLTFILITLIVGLLAWIFVNSTKGSAGSRTNTRRHKTNSATELNDTVEQKKHAG